MNSQTIFHLVPMEKFRSIYYMNRDDTPGQTPLMRRIIAYQLALAESLHKQEKQRADELQQQLSNLQGEL